MSCSSVCLRLVEVARDDGDHNEPQRADAPACADQCCRPDAVCRRYRGLTGAGRRQISRCCSVNECAGRDRTRYTQSMKTPNWCTLPLASIAPLLGNYNRGGGRSQAQHGAGLGRGGHQDPHRQPQLPRDRHHRLPQERWPSRNRSADGGARKPAHDRRSDDLSLRRGGEDWDWTRRATARISAQGKVTYRFREVSSKIRRPGQFVQGDAECGQKLRGVTFPARPGIDGQTTPI
jgi:hypothetical protein